MVVILLAALLLGGAGLSPPTGRAVQAVPKEPGSVVLPEAPTYQAVAADLDGDGSREIVRLVRGNRGSVRAEAWAPVDDGWQPAAAMLEVIPARPTPGQGNVVYTGTPVRLLLRHVDGIDRVTLVRQPRFEEPGIESECCLLLHDLVVRNGALTLPAVADPADSVDALLAIDMDGDGTEELLASRSLPPLGDISFPTEAQVYRWAGDRFGLPVTTELPVGSGDAPFILGDSDGLPGDEAAIISTIGRPALYRVSLAADDSLRVEDAGLVATDARAIPIGEGRGLAVIGPTVDMAVLRWPRGEVPEGPVAQRPIDGTLLGVVDVGDQPRVLVRQRDRELLHVLPLPDLSPARDAVLPSPAAAAFGGGLLRPYVGPLPGGGADDAPAVIYAGRLLPSDELRDAPFAAMAGAEPIGLVGPDRGWLAVLHAATPFGRIDPAGGRLDAPALRLGSGVSIAPFVTAGRGERDGGTLVPRLDGASELPRGQIAVDGDGFVARVPAPPGSRVYVGDGDGSIIRAVETVPDTGSLSVPIRPPPGTPPNAGYRASLSVVTPSGHGYVARWSARVLTEAPTLVTSVATPLGSASVEVAGRTAPYARVVVAGTDVPVDDRGRFLATVPAPPWPTEIAVTAVDPVGNVATATLSGVGLFDYRGLPWLPIMTGVVVAAAIMLFLRVPGARSRPPAGDDAALEELEPD